MMTYSDYFKIIDEIRLAKNITVSDLCEGIISERTYFRHMISNKGIKFDVFSKLAKKLGVTSEELVHYSVFVRKGDPGVTRFMYRVQVKHFDDIAELYPIMIDYKHDNYEMNLLLKTYVKKYQYYINKISYVEYKEWLKECLNLTKELTNEIDAISNIRALYLQEFSDDVQVLDTLLDYYVKSNHSIGFTFKLFGIDSILSLMVNTKYSTVENVKLLSEKFNEMLLRFDHKYFSMNSLLFSAYYYKLIDDFENLEETLAKYYLNLRLMIGYEDYDLKIMQLKTIFNINPVELLKKYSEKQFKSSKFILKNS